MRKFVILLFVFALLTAACGGDDSGSSSDTATTTTATAATETTAATATTAATETTAAPETTQATETTTTQAGESVESAAFYAALEKSTEIQSGRVEGTMTMRGVEGLDAGSEVSMGFSGEFDNTTGNSSFTMDLSDLAGAMPEGEEIPPEFSDMFGEMEIRTIGDTSYMKFGFFSMLGVGTEWVSMPAEDAGTAASSFGAGPTNPMEFMGAWSQAGTEVESLGSEDVRGASTTHYRVTIDVDAMVEAADDMAVEDLDSLGATFPGGTMPVDFWVGDDGNVYRVVMEIDGSTDASNGFSSLTMLWEMYDQGATITIEPPPADQVTDSAALGGMFSG